MKWQNEENILSLEVCSGYSKPMQLKPNRKNKAMASKIYPNIRKRKII